MYVRRRHVVVFLWCAMFTVGLTEGRSLRTRRSDCEYGTYPHEGRECCLCPRGKRVLKDCTDTNETDCELCEHGTYMDHLNSENECWPCKVCDSNANMEEQDKCSLYSNTVCKCKNSFYCEKGSPCKICYQCDTCEKYGVKKSCTETNNTVCHDAKEPENHQGATVAGLVLLLIVVAGVILVVLWLRRNKKYCFKGRPIDLKPPTLEDLDLDPHLLDIVDVLDWKTVKHIARHSGMRKAEMEEHELNNKNDVKEQKYALLHAWYERQGLCGAYPALINTLYEMKQRKTADEIRKIVEKGQN
ncbi:tumor necrosis factor receptor superfamily member 6 [Carassius gibelio]|uniref:tumor necrosis factor receptor superfamily member 6 n=1 Tax=Carassius gibelio TaxID=101364 RepID=UPI00227740CB|nr:tumor necrosis factor receptor superfamily member 6 [Carassius gibelio]